MTTRRLFIGLMAGGAREALSQYQLEYDWPSTARLTAPPHLHLTLLFLGNVEVDVERRMRAALANVPMTPLSLRLIRADMFPGGIAVLRPEENRALELLQGDIAALVQPLDLSIDPKPWVPHVTLARKAQGCVTPQLAAAIEWDVSQFSLVWSRPDGTGYDVLESWGRPPNIRHEITLLDE